MFCCTLLCVRSSIAIILMGKSGLVALLNLSSWCLVMVERLFLAVPQGCLRFVIVVFPDHTHLLVFSNSMSFSTVCRQVRDFNAGVGAVTSAPKYCRSKSASSPKIVIKII